MGKGGVQIESIGASSDSANSSIGVESSRQRMSNSTLLPTLLLREIITPTDPASVADGWDPAAAVAAMTRVAAPMGAR